MDIVQYGTVQVDLPGLVLPHPGLPEREFWRRELDELHLAGW
jgi:7,8-dihydro-6-hydroxymethylpterin-pyrophosphokinase